MKNNKLITSGLLGISTLSILLFPTVKVNALDYIKKENIICTETEAHKNWMNLSKEDRKKYPEPVLCEETHLITKINKNTNKSGMNKGLSTSYTSASSFDLRNVNGQSYLTPIRHQKMSNEVDSALCWAFSTNAAIESNILLNGGSAVDLSERHIGFSANGLLNDGTTNPYGTVNHTTSSQGEDSGGNHFISNNYLATNRGPILESKLPLETFVSSYANTVAQKQDYMVKKISWYSPSGECSDANIINTIKYMIVSYGAVSSNMFAGYEDMPEDQSLSLFNYTDDYIFNWYYNGTKFCKDDNNNDIECLPNHGIAIVGWDDNYSKDNFTTKPTGNGAWIVRNTYDDFATGDSQSDVGYHYISYYDVNVCQDVRAVDDVVQDSIDNRYLSAKYGYNKMIGWNADTIYYENKFTKSTNKDENLDSVSLFGLSGDKFEIYYSETENFANATKVASGVFNDTGYKTVKVLNPKTITNSTFYIYTKYIATVSFEQGDDTFYVYPIYYFNGPENSASPVYMEVPSVDPMDHRYSFDPNSDWKSTLSNEGISEFYPIVNVFTKNASYSVDAEEPTTSDTAVDTNGGTYFFKVNVNNGSLNDVSVNIYNSSNIDSTNKFAITKKSNGFDIAVKPNVTPAGTYTAVFTYNDATSSKQFEIVQAPSGEVDPVLVAGITVTAGGDEVSVNGILQLTATVTPNNASNKGVTWTSSDNTIATVDSTGKVTGVKAGNVTITATAKDGSNVKGTKNIKVVDINVEEGGNPTPPGGDQTPVPNNPEENNPKTGISTPVIASIVVVISAVVAYIVNKKRDFIKHFN